MTEELPRGRRFGRLVVIRASRSKRKGGTRYRCKCDCGLRTFVKGSKLRNGEAKDCGMCAEQLCKYSVVNQGD